MIDNKKIPGRIAKEVADEMVQKPGVDPLEIVKNNPNYQPLSSTPESTKIESLVDKVLKDNPQSIENYYL